MTLHWMQLLWASLIGGGIGFLSGLFGIGGSFLLVPGLAILLDVPMSIAVGSGACQVLGPATTSLLARQLRWIHLQLPLMITGGLFLGVFAGTETLEAAKSSHWSAGGMRLSLEFLVLSTYLVLLIGLGGFSVWEVYRAEQGRPLGRGWVARWKLPPTAELPGFPVPRVSIPILCWFGFTVGFLGGFLGMSGGLVLLPGLVYLFGMKTHQAMVTSLVIVWLISFQATILHGWNGNIDLSLVLAILISGTLGARYGSALSDRLGGQQLRQYFGWLLLATALMILMKIVQMTQ